MLFHNSISFHYTKKRHYPYGDNDTFQSIINYNIGKIKGNFCLRDALLDNVCILTQ